MHVTLEDLMFLGFKYLFQLTGRPPKTVVGSRSQFNINTPKVLGFAP